MKKNYRWIMIIGALILVSFIIIVIIKNPTSVDAIAIKETTLDDDTLVLTFSDDIILNEKTENCFSIKDEEGKEIPVELRLSIDNKKVYVNIDEGVKGYKLGDKYTLCVTKGVQSLDYADLENDYYYEFQVDEKQIDFILGLGNILTDAVCNDRDYEWYIDQGITGTYAIENAGAACAVMASKWVSKEKSTNVPSARKTIKSTGGLWTTEDVQIYLEQKEIDNIVVEFTDIEEMKNEVKNGNILIVHVDTSKISYNSDFSLHIGRFYEYEGPHFFIIKGYKEVDGKIYFEVYDPNNFSKRYSDNTPKGKDRYYLSDEVLEGMKAQWNYYFIIKEA
ncbi:hypothetical protein [Clostridium sp. DL1XJH146]